MPKHIYEGTDFRTNPANNTPIGTGPFKLKEWVRGSHIHLVRNDDYWQPGKPYLDEIYYRVLPDAARARRRDGDRRRRISPPSPTSRLSRCRACKALPHLEMTTKGYEYLAQIVWLDFNLRSAPLNDKRFRQAVYHAIDRNFIRDRIWFGLGKVATGPIHSSIPHYERGRAEIPLRPQEGRGAARRDGPQARHRTACARESRSTPCPMATSTSGLSSTPSRRSAASASTSRSAPPTSRPGATASRNWDYEMTYQVLSQLGHPALGVSRLYVSSNIRKGVLFSNVNGYSNPRIDELFDQARGRGRRGRRARGCTREIQKILVDDVPVAWLLELDFPTFINKQFKNVVTSAIGVRDTFADVYMVPAK